MKFKRDYYKAHRVLRMYKNRFISASEMQLLAGKLMFDSYHAAVKTVL